MFRLEYLSVVQQEEHTALSWTQLVSINYPHGNVNNKNCEVLAAHMTKHLFSSWFSGPSGSQLIQTGLDRALSPSSLSLLAEWVD